MSISHFHYYFTCDSSYPLCPQHFREEQIYQETLVKHPDFDHSMTSSVYDRQAEVHDWQQVSTSTSTLLDSIVEVWWNLKTTGFEENNLTFSIKNNKILSYNNLSVKELSITKCVGLLAIILLSNILYWLILEVQTQLQRCQLASIVSM